MLKNLINAVGRTSGVNYLTNDVKSALDEGVIAPERYNSYLSIYNNDEEENYR